MDLSISFFDFIAYLPMIMVGLSILTLIALKLLCR